MKLSGGLSAFVWKNSQNCFVSDQNTFLSYIKTSCFCVKTQKNLFCALVSTDCNSSFETQSFGFVITLYCYKKRYLCFIVTLTHRNAFLKCFMLGSSCIFPGVRQAVLNKKMPRWRQHGERPGEREKKEKGGVRRCCDIGTSMPI